MVDDSRSDVDVTVAARDAGDAVSRGLAGAADRVTTAAERVNRLGLESLALANATIDLNLAALRDVVACRSFADVVEVQRMLALGTMDRAFESARRMAGGPGETVGVAALPAAETTVRTGTAV